MFYTIQRSKGGNTMYDYKIHELLIDENVKVKSEILELKKKIEELEGKEYDRLIALKDVLLDELDVAKYERSEFVHENRHCIHSPEFAYENYRPEIKKKLSELEKKEKELIIRVNRVMKEMEWPDYEMIEFEE